MIRLKELEGWRSFDTQGGILFPWYTRPFLQELMNWNVREWKVFEYGAGDSTLWWRQNAKMVQSVDTNKAWAERSGAIWVTNKQDFLSCPESLAQDEKYDCIVIDGEPVEWRDECTEHALRCVRSGGKIIIDNYKQNTVSLGEWPLTDRQLAPFPVSIFKEPSHPDWKTACWTIF
jgi:predicted O-methyltransferase YrrM